MIWQGVGAIMFNGGGEKLGIVHYLRFSCIICIGLLYIIILCLLIVSLISWISHNISAHWYRTSSICSTAKRSGLLSDSSTAHSPHICSSPVAVHPHCLGHDLLELGPGSLRGLDQCHGHRLLLATTLLCFSRRRCDFVGIFLVPGVAAVAVVSQARSGLEVHGRSQWNV